MKIVEYYSHLNGLEFLLVHKPELWKEIKDVIHDIDGEHCKVKVSKEKRTRNKLLYSPVEMNRQFKKRLAAKSWNESRVSYWVTSDRKLIQQTMT